MATSTRNNKLYVTIPTYFRCPISLELMKSPVSLSTGITYDRSSIQAWLDGGHTTCPATMIPLSSPSFVPNLTLHRLIHLWSLSLASLPSTCNDISSCLSSKSLKETLDHARKSEESRRVLASSDEFVALVVGLVKRFDPVRDGVQELELVIEIMDMIVTEFEGARQKIHRMMFDGALSCLSTFVFVLRNASSVETKAAAARVLERITINTEAKRFVFETPGLVDQLYSLVNTNSNYATESSLSTMIAMAVTKSAKTELVRMGFVQAAVRILCDAGRTGTVVQRAMEMLELLSTSPEGRSAICDDEVCVVQIVKRLMKVNEKATEHGVTVLWSVCYLFRDEKARDTVGKSNGLGKCLLLLQSNCSAIVKQMCRDLVKVLRVNSRSCLGGYDTKTTHIMPY